MSRSPPPSSATRGASSWLTRLLTSLGAAAALVVSFFLGALVFLTALGLLVLLAVGVAIRIWWLRRQFRRRSGGDSGPSSDRGGKVIEGDYVIIQRRRRRSKRDGQD